ncbi:hypothetical protein [Streptomyces sp. NPDC058495]
MSGEREARERLLTVLTIGIAITGQSVELYWRSRREADEPAGGDR